MIHKVSTLLLALALSSVLALPGKNEAEGGDTAMKIMDKLNLVVDTQQNQKERYLKDIRERVDYMRAIHHVVKDRLEEKLSKERAGDSKPLRKDRISMGKKQITFFGLEELRDAEPQIMRTLDLVIARQELERVQYLNDIRERVQHLGAVHRYAEEHPEDPINRMSYGAPCRRRRSATWSPEQLNERAEDEVIPVRSGAVQNGHGETTAMRIMDKLNEVVNNQQVEYEKYLRDIHGTVDYMGAKHGLARVEAAPLDAPTNRAPLVESASEILRTLDEVIQRQQFLEDQYLSDIRMKMDHMGDLHNVVQEERLERGYPDPNCYGCRAEEPSYGMPEC